MNRSTQRILASFALGLLMLVVGSGCRVSGWGTIPSASGRGTASFAIRATFNDDLEDPVWVGEGGYQDRSRGLAAHLEATEQCLAVPGFEEFGFGLLGRVADECGLDVEELRDHPERFLVVVGRYTPSRGSRGKGGCFVLAAVDGGVPGSSSGDAFAIAFYGGVYDRYFNCGSLRSGNIQVQPGT